MTAAQLIEALKTLPPETIVVIFDPEDSTRYQIDTCDTLDHWCDNHADLNLLARTNHIQA